MSAPLLSWDEEERYLLVSQNGHDVRHGKAAALLELPGVLGPLQRRPVSWQHEDHALVAVVENMQFDAALVVQCEWEFKQVTNPREGRTVRYVLLPKALLPPTKERA